MSIASSAMQDSGDLQQRWKHLKKHASDRKDLQSCNTYTAPLEYQDTRSIHVAKRSQRAANGQAASQTTLVEKQSEKLQTCESPVVWADVEAPAAAVEASEDAHAIVYSKTVTKQCMTNKEVYLNSCKWGQEHLTITIKFNSFVA
eukprot:766015-Hanusia_phi.AAC.3